MCLTLSGNLEANIVVLLSEGSMGYYVKICNNLFLNLFLLTAEQVFELSVALLHWLLDVMEGRGVNDASITFSLPKLINNYAY